MGDESEIRRYLDDFIEWEFHRRQRGEPEINSWTWRNYCMRNDLGKSVYLAGVEEMGWEKVAPWIGLSGKSWNPYFRQEKMKEESKKIKRKASVRKNSKKIIYSGSIFLKPLPELKEGEKSGFFNFGDIFDVHYIATLPQYKYIKKLYPDLELDDFLGNLRVQFENDPDADYHMMYDLGYGILTINLNSLKDKSQDFFAELLLHEVTHWMQDRSGRLNSEFTDSYERYFGDPNEKEAFETMFYQQFMRGKTKQEIYNDLLKEFGLEDDEEESDLEKYLFKQFIKRYIDNAFRRMERKILRTQAAGPLEKEDPLRRAYSSVLDFPRKTLDPELWELENPPKLKEEVKKKIVDTLKNWLEEKGYEDFVNEMYFIGSSAGYQYRKVSDIDITIIPDPEKIDDPKSLVREMVTELNGYLIGQHPVNYYVRVTADIPPGEAIYSLTTDSWIKSPSPPEYDPEIKFRSEISQAEARVSVIDTVIGILHRRLVDYDILKEEGRDVEKKLETINRWVSWLGREYLDIWAARKRAYEAEGKQGTRANILYKYLERYGYLDLMHFAYEKKSGIEEKDIKTLKKKLDIFDDLL